MTLPSFGQPIARVDVNLDALDGVVIAAPAAGDILIYDGVDSWRNRAVSGDITINSVGLVAISPGVIVDADISATAEIQVSKLADGNARQVLQTDAAGTGVEWTDDIDIPGTLDVTALATFDDVISAIGGQVLFPSVQVPSADVNALDDYEEGTFTPEIADDSGDGSGEGQTYNIQLGVYTKVGNRVFFSITLQITSIGTLTAGQGARIVGLPFTAIPIVNVDQAASVGFAAGLNLANASETPTGFILASTAYVRMENWDGIGGTSLLLISEVSGSGNMRLSGQYAV